MTGDVMPVAISFCGICPRPSDGRVCRSCAGKLGAVLPDTVSAWISRGHLTDVQYEGTGKRKRPWCNPAEVIQVGWDLHGRERQRMAFLAGQVPDMEDVA